MMVDARALSVACADTLVALKGDAGAQTRVATSLQSMQSEALVFVKAIDANIIAILEQLQRGVAVAHAGLIHEEDIPAGCAVLECVNPRLGFARCIRAHFDPQPAVPGLHPSAVIDDGAVIHPTAHIGAHCYIGPDCQVGAHSVIMPNVTIQRQTLIGRHVVINSGTVIGADGFGYEQNSSGGYEKFPHSGGVRIDDHVEIGANSCVDRGVLDDTWIKRGAKIDNLVHVAHNVIIGEDAIVIALSMLGGSVHIGDRAWIAPAATIINQKSVGTDAVVGLAAVVTKDVADRQTVMGSPAVDQAQFKVMNARLKALSS